MKKSGALSLFSALAFLVALLALSGAALKLSADEKIATISVEDLQKRLQSKEAKPLLVDVREPEEFDAGHIEGALLQPLGTVAELKADKAAEIMLVCHSGRRSAKAYAILASQGFTRLRNVEGGMVAWEKLGYPVVKK